jgi:alkaline phosphatase
MTSSLFQRSTLAACVMAALATTAAMPVSANATAKNVMLFISDGASWGTWDMASYWEYGKKGMQPYDSFDVKLGMTTYPLNTSNTPTFDPTPKVTYDPGQAWNFSTVGTSYGGTPDYFAGYNYIKKNYTDSAAAGTALATGQKTYNNAIDFDNSAQPLGYITQDAKAAGKATGILSSVPFTHATPATFGAQNISRNHYGEISKTMVNNPSVDLIMGGGNPFYDSNGKPRATPVYANETGTGGGYVAKSAWDTVTNPASGWQLIQSKSDFEALANGTLTVTGSKVIGVPQVYDTLQYSRNAGVVGLDPANPSGHALINGVPTLEVMTKGALNYLGQDPDGLFMMVEGGAVDWAAHANATGRIIEEQIDFNKAVQAAINWVNTNSSWDETLMIVLTDHGNGMPMGPNSDVLAFQAIQNNGQGVLPGVKWHYGTHTNENTLFWAHGVGSEMFYSLVDGIDPGLVHVLGHNADGKYISNTDVYDVMAATMPAVPLPASVFLLGGALVPMLALRRRKAA